MDSIYSQKLLSIFIILSVSPYAHSRIEPDFQPTHPDDIQLKDPVKDNVFQPNNDQRYRGLFQTEENIEKLVSYRSIEENFRVRKFTEYSFEGTCSYPLQSQYSYKLPTCSSIIDYRKESLNECCRTKMSIIIPSVVVSIYSGIEYNVTHYQSSYQLLHQGKCANYNAPCYVSGRCRQSYRVQWMLVDMPDGTESFVPVRIPNHCFCKY